MSLPREIDFDLDRAATPERMNRAMEYLWILVKGVAALKPDYDAAIAELQGIGLERINAILQPIFLRATEIAAALEAHYAKFGYVPANRAGDTFTGPIVAPSVRTPAVAADTLLALMVAGVQRARIEATGATFTVPVEVTAALTTNGRPHRPAAEADAECWWRSHGF